MEWSSLAAASDSDMDLSDDPMIGTQSVHCACSMNSMSFLRVRIGIAMGIRVVPLYVSASTMLVGMEIERLSKCYYSASLKSFLVCIM